MIASIWSVLCQDVFSPLIVSIDWALWLLVVHTCHWGGFFFPMFFFQCEIIKMSGVCVCVCVCVCVWCVKCIWSDWVAVHSQKSVKLHWGTVTLLLIFMGWLRSHKFLEVLEDDIGKSYHIYIYMSAWSGVPVSSWIPSRERRGHARSELCSGGLGCLGGLFKSKVSMSLEEASCLQHLTTNYVGILCKIAVEACQRKADLLQACFKLGRPLLHQNLDVRHVPEQ